MALVHLVLHRYISKKTPTPTFSQNAFGLQLSLSLGHLVDLLSIQLPPHASPLRLGWPFYESNCEIFVYIVQNNWISDTRHGHKPAVGMSIETD